MNPGSAPFSTGQNIRIGRARPTAGFAIPTDRIKPAKPFSIIDALLGRQTGPQIATGNLAAPMYDTSSIPSASFKVNPSLRAGRDAPTFTTVRGEAGSEPLGPDALVRDVLGRVGGQLAKRFGINQESVFGDGTSNFYERWNNLPPGSSQAPAPSRPYAEYGGETSAQIMGEVASQLQAGNFPGRLPLAQASSLGVVQDFLNLGYTIQSGALVAPQGGAQPQSTGVTSLGDNAYRVGKNFGARGDKWRVIYRDGQKITVATGGNRRGGGGQQGQTQQAQPQGFGLVNWRVSSG